MLTLRQSSQLPLTAIVTERESVDISLSREWLLTNGRGGYASSTILGCNTRSYHGLLIGSVAPPTRRIMALSTCLETLTVGDRTWSLSTFEFGDRFSPAGYLSQCGFRQDIGVHFDHVLGDLKVTKSIYLVRDVDTVVLVYEFSPIEEPVELAIRPMVGLRDFHGLQRYSAPLTARWIGDGVLVRHQVPGSCELRLTCAQGIFEETPQWWYNFAYRQDRQRGQAFTEDLWSPGVFRCTVDGSGPIVLTAQIGTQTPGPSPVLDIDDLEDDLTRRQVGLVSSVPKRHPILRRLSLAADQFLAHRIMDGKPQTTILAGYPWFADWGRDAMISLPGLLLAFGRFEQARSVLLTFSQVADGGMIPNCFDDYDSVAHFNSVDASLWFVHAAFRYLHLSGDHKTFDQEFLPVILSILDAYQRGTRFGIHADVDGLITAGDTNTQLTWMDAKCDGTTFTPRHGKAVEINALWYNALCLIGQYYAGHDAASARSYKMRADQVAEGFCELFWNEKQGYLNDTVWPDGTSDTSLRPNQIFALSLPYTPPLSCGQQIAILTAVQKALLTPYGLRTLDTGHPAYRGVYTGHQPQRDQAYHQGTVWPFLIGAFVEAFLKVNGFNRKTKRQAAEFIRPLLDHLTQDGCVGSVSEILDGDPPHHPKGCFAQAWSVAELTRAYLLVHV